MRKVRTSGNPVSDLIVYQIRAMDDEHWLEAIVLTHMFVETQLRIITGRKPVRQKRNPPKDEKLIELAKEAMSQGLIENPLFQEIDAFNTARNDAVHNLALGLITYEQLEPFAKQADRLVTKLQGKYLHLGFAGPEEIIPVRRR